MMNVTINSMNFQAKNTAERMKLAELMRSAEYADIFRALPVGRENAVYVYELAKRFKVAPQMIIHLAAANGNFKTENLDAKMPCASKYTRIKTDKDTKVRHFAELDENGKIINTWERSAKDRYIKIWIED